MEANIWQVICGTRYQCCSLSIEALAKLLITTVVILSGAKNLVFSEG